jgi:hypothetical protein
LAWYSVNTSSTKLRIKALQNYVYKECTVATVCPYLFFTDLTGIVGCVEATNIRSAGMSDRERLNPFGEGPIDLDPFHELEATLAWYDRQFEYQIAIDPDPTYVELSASLAAHGTVLTFLANCGIKSRALSRLQIALAQVHSGDKQPPMLTARAPAHRLPDNDSTQILKGGLAAIMRLRQKGGEGREHAAKWVVRHMSPEMPKKLRLQDRPAGMEWETVVKWANRFGNDMFRALRFSPD